MNKIVRGDHVGNATLQTLKRNFRFSSHAYFVDHNNRKIILITGSPLFNTENITRIILETEEKIPIQKALTRAIKKGRDPRFFPLDRSETVRTQLKRVNPDIFKPHDVCPVYFVHL